MLRAAHAPQRTSAPPPCGANAVCAASRLCAPADGIPATGCQSQPGTSLRHVQVPLRFSAQPAQLKRRRALLPPARRDATMGAPAAALSAATPVKARARGCCRAQGHTRGARCTFGHSRTLLPRPAGALMGRDAQRSRCTRAAVRRQSWRGAAKRAGAAPRACVAADHRPVPPVEAPLGRCHAGDGAVLSARDPVRACGCPRACAGQR
jgi:hypothetical protein